MISAILTTLLPLISQVLEKYIGSKEKAKEAEKEILINLLRNKHKLDELRTQIIIAETKSESWLTRSWRPITMLVFVSLVVADWFGFTPPNLPLDLKLRLYDLIETGILGYIAARSGEKAMKSLAQAMTNRQKPKISDETDL